MFINYVRYIIIKSFVAVYLHKQFFQYEMQNYIKFYIKILLFKYCVVYKFYKRKIHKDSNDEIVKYYFDLVINDIS